jgi:hypothetical protein
MVGGAGIAEARSDGWAAGTGDKKAGSGEVQQRLSSSGAPPASDGGGGALMGSASSSMAFSFFFYSINCGRHQNASVNTSFTVTLGSRRFASPPRKTVFARLGKG